MNRFLPRPFLYKSIPLRHYSTPSISSIHPKIKEFEGAQQLYMDADSLVENEFYSQHLPLLPNSISHSLMTPVSTPLIVSSLSPPPTLVSPSPPVNSLLDLMNKEEYLAINIKRIRKSKMNKHKYKKRMRIKKRSSKGKDTGARKQQQHTNEYDYFKEQLK